MLDQTFNEGKKETKKWLEMKRQVSADKHFFVNTSTLKEDMQSRSIRKHEVEFY